MDSNKNKWFLGNEAKLGEPKTSADFEEIEEDEIFSKYWDKEHPSVVYQLGTSSDTETDSQRQDSDHDEDI